MQPVSIYGPASGDVSSLLFLVTQPDQVAEHLKKIDAESARLRALADDAAKRMVDAGETEKIANEKHQAALSREQDTIEAATKLQSRMDQFEKDVSDFDAEKEQFNKDKQELLNDIAAREEKLKADAADLDKKATDRSDELTRGERDLQERAVKVSNSQEKLDALIAEYESKVAAIRDAAKTLAA